MDIFQELDPRPNCKPRHYESKLFQTVLEDLEACYLLSFHGCGGPGLRVCPCGPERLKVAEDDSGLGDPRGFGPTIRVWGRGSTAPV